MSSNHIARDYGSYITQWHDWLETTGLADPADRFDPPAGPALTFPEPVTRYPLDEAA